MPDSILAFVEDGDGDGDHLSLGQGQVAIPVHKAIVEGHKSTESGRIQAVGFDDVVDTTPGAARALVYLGHKARGFILVDGLDPGIVKGN